MIYYFINSILTLPLLYKIISSVIEFRYKKKKIIIVISTAIAVTIFSDMLLLMSGVNLTDIYSFAPITTVIPSFISLFYLAKRRDLSFMFIYLSMCVIGSIISFLAGILAFLLPWHFKIIEIAFHVGMLFLLLFVCRRFFNYKYFSEIEKKKNWIILCIFPLICIITWFSYKASSAHNYGTAGKVNFPYAGYIYPQYIILILLLLACALYCFIIIAIIISTSYSAYLEQNKKAALEKQIAVLKEQCTSYEDKEEDLKILRHDFKIHLNIISVLVQNRDYDKTQEYLNKINNELAETKHEIYCRNNTILNAILAYYIDKCRKIGIIFNHQIQIPDFLPADDFDIGAVTGNILDNAYNACKKQKDDDYKFIDFKFIHHRRQYIMSVHNSFCGAVQFDGNGYPVSTKLNHGIGSMSIRAFENKYNSTVDYSVENSVFKICIMFSDNN